LSFIPLAKSKGVTIYAKKDDFFSFFNSPYYSHINSSAVDIYPRKSDLEVPALSPVDGTLSKIYEIKTPRPRYFEAPETERLILITPKENPNTYVRLLHINSQIQTGTHVSVGDQLGVLLRSGFFNFWTSRHVHVEIRRLEEPFRAKGGYSLEPINTHQNILQQRTSEMPSMRVSTANKDYVLVEVGGGLSRIGNFWGLECRVDNKFGLLDCGVPHYLHGGIHTMDTTSIQVGDTVRLWKTTIGKVVQVFKNLVRFESTPLSIYVNDLPIGGLSLHPWLGKARVIRLIPKHPHELQDLRIGEKIHLSLVVINRSI
jgi:hypothetical protein